MRFLLSTAVLCSTLISLHAASTSTSPSTFPPLEQWKSAVASGNQSTLDSLYSTSPPAQLYRDKQPVGSLADEINFWSGLKSAGVSDFNPKILSLKNANGQEQLVLRISALAGSAAAVGGVHHIVASMVQIWLQEPAGWRLALSNRSDFQLDNGRRLPEPARPNPNLYPPPSAAPTELKQALQQAGQQHKRVLVVFGANWCYDCHVLDTTFRSPQFAPLLAANYVVVHVNIGDEGKDNNDLAKRLGVNIDRGTPNLAVLDPDGHVVVAQQNGEFESTVRIGPDDVHAFLVKYAPPHA